MKYVRHYFKNTSGATAVEFALIVPLLLIILSGMFEVAMYIFLHNKISRVSGTMSFLASRPGVTETSLKTLMDAADVIAKPFNFNLNGGIIISQINVNPDATMTIAWQRKTGIGASRIGAAGNAPSNLPNNIQLKSGQNLIIAEAFYNYEPFIFNYYTFNSVIYKISTFTPRQGSVNLDPS
ncbi:MAG: pilus assembly protein [Alphaproteobacteria bacterium]|nr:pilus assembly protein [Alphaproteobacteria bacterium]